MTRRKDRTPAQLRRFGLVMAVPLAVIAALLAWKGKPAWPVLAGLAAAFALLGLAVPRALAPVEKAWMWLASVLNAVVTRVLLVLAFVLVVTPIGLLMRLLGKRPLPLGIDRKVTTYWRPVEPDGPASRPDKPY